MIYPYYKNYNKKLEKPIVTLPDKLWKLHSNKLNITGKM